MGDPSGQFSIGDYVSTGELLGKGSFAKVYRGRLKESDKDVAIKVIDMDRLSRTNQKLKHHLYSEIKIMKTIQHENIVGLYDVYTPDDVYIYMILEYCKGGDFAKYLAKQAGRYISEAKALYFMKQLASGLKHLRQKKIIHRDLKPQNLLLSSDDETAVLKIADFGFARIIEPQSVAETLCGSPLYMAPEILRFQKYNEKVDLWSVGAIFFEMLTGGPPFKCKNQYELMHMLETTNIIIPEPIRSKLSFSCINLLFSLLQKDHHRRISWDDFFAHPWLGLASLPDVRSTQSMPNSLPSSIPSRPIFPILSPEDGKTSSLVLGETSSRSRSISGMILENETLLATPPFLITPGVPTSKSTTPSSPVLPTFPLESFSKKAGESSDEDSFELIHSETNSAPKFSSSSSLTSSDKNLSVDDLQRILNRIKMIADAGDSKVVEAPNESFVVYLKTLKLLLNLFNLSTEKAPSFSSDELQFQSILRQIRECTTEYQRKAEKLKSQISTSERMASAEKVLYDHALSIGRGAAVYEMYKNYVKSEKMYLNGLNILHQLLHEATDEIDKTVLKEYISSFSKRLAETINKKQTANKAKPF